MTAGGVWEVPSLSKTIQLLLVFSGWSEGTRNNKNKIRGEWSAVVIPTVLHPKWTRARPRCRTETPQRTLINGLRKQRIAACVFLSLRRLSQHALELRAAHWCGSVQKVLDETSTDTQERGKSTFQNKPKVSSAASCKQAASKPGNNRCHTKQVSYVAESIWETARREKETLLHLNSSFYPGFRVHVSCGLNKTIQQKRKRMVRWFLFLRNRVASVTISNVCSVGCRTPVTEDLCSVRQEGASSLRANWVYERMSEWTRDLMSK